MVIILNEVTTNKMQIIFTGNSFKSVIDDLGEEKVECVPIIYRKESSIGLKIEIKDRKRFLFIEENNNDLFRVYRTMRIVSHLGVLNTNLFGSAFMAADRIKELSMLGFSPPLSNIIKQGDLRKIMMELVPEEIIQAVIGDGKELSENDKSILKQEILAETIFYDERIAKLEIKKPQEIIKEIEEIKVRALKTQIRLNPVLESYFEWFEDLNGAITQEVINIALLDKFNFSDETLVAILGFLVQMDYYFSLRVEAEEDSFSETLFNDRSNEVATGSIYWLSSEMDCTPDEAAKELDNALNVILASK